MEAAILESIYSRDLGIDADGNIVSRGKVLTSFRDAIRQAVLSEDLEALGVTGVPIEAFLLSTDPSDAPGINRAAALAGINGKLAFKAGKTYRYDRPLVPSEGQTWELNGATLKQSDCVQKTLNASTAAGAAPTFVMPNTTGFFVGQHVNFYKSTWAANLGANEGNFCEATTNFEIIAVTATTVRVSGTTTVNYVSGDYIVLSTIGIWNEDDPGIAVKNGIFDGNKQSYIDASPFSAGVYWGNWAANCDFRVAGDRTSTENLYFFNQRCEAMIIGGRGSNHFNITGINTGGNLFHLTSNTPKGGCVVEGVYARANGMGSSLLHVHGIISISNPVPDFTFKDIEGDGLADDGTTSVTPRLIGGINEGTSNLTIEGVHLRNLGLGTAGARLQPFIDFSTTWTAGTNVDGITLKRFRVEDCGNLVISRTTNDTTRFTNVILDDIRMTKGKVFLQRVASGYMRDCFVDNSTTPTTAVSCYEIAKMENFAFINLRGNMGTSILGAFVVTDTLTDCIINGGLLDGGNKGLYFTVAATRSTAKNVSVRHRSGVTSSNPSGIVVGGSGWTIDNCEVNSTVVSGGSVRGMHITAGTGVICKNNNIRMGDGSRTAVEVASGCVSTQLINNVQTLATVDGGTTTHEVNVATHALYAA